MSNNIETAGDWSNESTEFPPDFYNDLPVPLYWRVIIAPRKPKEITKSGLIIPVQNQEAQEVLNCVGVIVALGSYAGASDRLGGDGDKPNSAFPKVGDAVFYGRHAGAYMLHKGVKLILLNDDEILAVLPNPDTIATSV